MEFEKLREIIADVMNIDEKEIKEDSSFENDLGADSLDVFQIIMGIEDAFDIEISNTASPKNSRRSLHSYFGRCFSFT